jgi:hypothetical protein
MFDDYLTTAERGMDRIMKFGEGKGEVIAQVVEFCLSAPIAVIAAVLAFPFWCLEKLCMRSK